MLMSLWNEAAALLSCATLVRMEVSDAPESAPADVAAWICVVSRAESWAVEAIDDDIPATCGTLGSAAADERSVLVDAESVRSKVDSSRWRRELEPDEASSAAMYLYTAVPSRTPPDAPPR